MLIVSREQARKALMHVHGFDMPLKGKRGVLDFFKRHPCVQSDPLNVAGRNHDLTLQSRVSDYNSKYLDELLYKDRKLFEYYCKMASIMPMESYSLFADQRARMEKRFAPDIEKHPVETEEVLAAMESGPVSSRDFSGEKREHWWGSTKIHRIVMDTLWMAGRIIIHHRDGCIKYYTLPDKIISKKILDAEPLHGLEADSEVAMMIVSSARLVGHGGPTWQLFNIGRPGSSKVAILNLERIGRIVPLQTDFLRGTFYVPIEDEGIWRDPPEPKQSVRFIAPLDPMMWNHQLFTKIFGQGYTWEVYKRPEDRKYGYYCLPVLFNGNYVCLIEPFFRMEDKVLEIRSFHILNKAMVKRNFSDALGEELSRFAGNLGAEHIEAKGKCPAPLMSAIALYNE